jgi:hypothetical protein
MGGTEVLPRAGQAGAGQTVRHLDRPGEDSRHDDNRDNVDRNNSHRDDHDR